MVTREIDKSDCIGVQTSSTDRCDGPVSKDHLMSRFGLAVGLHDLSSELTTSSQRS